MIGQQGDHVLFIGEHVIGKATQGAFWPHFYKGAYPVIVERMQPFHPLHGRRNLLLQIVFDRFHAGGVHAAGDIGDDGQLRRPYIQSIQHLAQRGAGRGNNFGVEGVADGDGHRFVTIRFKLGDRFLHGRAGAAKDTLALAVDIGGHDIAVDAG